jgi:hypothetical protein
MNESIKNTVELRKYSESAPFTGNETVQTVRPIGGVEVWLYSFLTTALEGGEGSASRPVRKGNCTIFSQKGWQIYRS